MYRFSNKLVVFCVLGIMVVMAAMGLVFALKTQDFRRRNDFRVAKVTPAKIQAPTRFSLLGYLPPRTNLLVGMQIAQALQEVETKKLLTEPRPELLDLGLAWLGKLTGLKLEDFDHVVLGANIDGSMPQFTVVVNTRQPYRIEELAKVLQADKIQEHREKPVFAFPLQPVGEGRLWCPEPQTLVLVLRLDAFKKTDLDEVPFRPRQGYESLSEPLREVMGRLGKQNLAWVAGHGDWQDLLALAPLLSPAGGKGTKRPKDAMVSALESAEGKLLAKVKTFGLGLEMQQGPVIRGQLFAGDEATTRQLQKWLEKIAADQPNLRVEVPPKEVPGPEAFWITLQWRLDLKELREKMGSGNKATQTK